MTSTRTVIIPVLFVLTITLMGLWCATQWVAGALEYDARLGGPWFHLQGVPVYRP